MTIKQFLKHAIGEKKLLFLSGIDAFQRYLEISLLIPKKKEITVLDVGGANARLSFFINGKVYFLDNSLNKLNKSVKHNICADGCALPFKDNSFDYITSVACLEHIPTNQKICYLKELKRVCKRKVLLYAPIGSIAEEYDKKLLKIRMFLRMEDKWTKEHLKFGLPEEELLFKEDFIKIQNIQNAKVWLVCMILQSLPVIKWFLPGVSYSLFLRFFDRKGPYIAGIFSHTKNNIVSD